MLIFIENCEEKYEDVSVTKCFMEGAQTADLAKSGEILTLVTCLAAGKHRV